MCKSVSQFTLSKFSEGSYEPDCANTRGKFIGHMGDYMQWISNCRARLHEGNIIFDFNTSQMCDEYQTWFEFGEDNILPFTLDHDNIWGILDTKTMLFITKTCCVNLGINADKSAFIC